MKSPSEDPKKEKTKVISGNLKRAVAIAKGMNPDILSEAEYDRKLKRFEEDVKTAYPDLDEKQIRADFEGMTAREVRWENVKEGESFVGMDPKDFPKSDPEGRPLSMEQRLHDARNPKPLSDHEEKPGFRTGSKESKERIEREEKANSSSK